MRKKTQFIAGLLLSMVMGLTGQSIAHETKDHINKYDTGGENAKDEKYVYHFGYGSNMDEDFMRKYTPSLKFVTKAKLPNFEIQFRKYSTNLKGGISSIIPKPGGMINGVIYTILKSEMDALDILEEVPEGVYLRQTFKVIGEDGKWYNGDLYRVGHPKGPFTPSLQYLGYMIKGAKAHKIDPNWIKYLEELRAQTIKNPSKK